MIRRGCCLIIIAMKPIEPITLPFRFVRQLGDLSRCPASVVQGWAHHAGIAPNLFAQPNARITVEQFARFYRQAMFALDDETPAFF